MYVKIYTDDTLTYTSPLISAEQKPILFSVNLSGVERWRISIPGESVIRLIDIVLDES